MPDLILPHGGSELINRSVPVAAVADFKAKVPTSTALPISDADLSTLYRIADGGLSPLTGPMTKVEYDRVLEEEVFERNGKKYAWTIPLAFPVDEATASQLNTGSPHPLRARSSGVRNE